MKTKVLTALQLRYFIPFHILPSYNHELHRFHFREHWWANSKEHARQNAKHTSRITLDPIRLASSYFTKTCQNVKISTCLKLGYTPKYIQLYLQWNAVLKTFNTGEWIHWKLSFSDFSFGFFLFVVCVKHESFSQFT